MSYYRALDGEMDRRKEMTSVITNFMWLTMCIYFEGRNQDMEGMVAVGHVIMTRVERRDASVKDIVLAPYQFSWTNKNDPQKRIINDINSLVRAANAATKVLEERLEGKDFFGADHYFNWKEVLPGWAKDMKFIARIKDHDFYKG